MTSRMLTRLGPTQDSSKGMPRFEMMLRGTAIAMLGERSLSRIFASQDAQD